MDKPIREGDLAMVVKPRPCGHGKPGAIFRVGKIRPSKPGGWMCEDCGQSWGVTVGAFEEGDDKESDFTALYRLKRIPPLDELETVRTEDEVTA